MERQASVSRSQDGATGFYPKSDESRPYHHNLLP